MIASMLALDLQWPSKASNPEKGMALARSPLTTSRSLHLAQLEVAAAKSHVHSNRRASSEAVGR